MGLRLLFFGDQLLGFICKDFLEVHAAAVINLNIILQDLDLRSLPMKRALHFLKLRFDLLQVGHWISNSWFRNWKLRLNMEKRSADLRNWR